MGEIMDKTKGRIKQAVGSLTGNESLKREGRRDELKGKAEGLLEDAKQAAKETVKDVKHAVDDAT